MEQKIIYKIVKSGRMFYLSILVSASLISILFFLLGLVIVLPFIWLIAIIGIGLSYVYVQSHYIEFDENEIHAQEGLINTKNLFAPYRNVDHVKIKSNIVHKIFQLSELRIDTSGRNETEIVITDIPHSKAIKAVKLIRSKREYNKENTINEEENIEKEGTN
jgi:uncharacterized membrane protein YdbT with pleckstrin-like domain